MLVNRKEAIGEAENIEKINVLIYSLICILNIYFMPTMYQTSEYKEHEVEQDPWTDVWNTGP